MKTKQLHDFLYAARLGDMIDPIDVPTGKKYFNRDGFRVEERHTFYAIGNQNLTHEDMAYLLRERLVRSVVYALTHGTFVQYVITEKGKRLEREMTKAELDRIADNRSVRLLAMSRRTGRDAGPFMPEAHQLPRE